MKKTIILLLACLTLCGSFASARGNFRVNRAVVEREMRKTEQKTRTRILEELSAITFPERFSAAINYLKAKDAYISHAQNGTLTQEETQAGDLYGQGKFTEAFQALGFDMQTVLLSLEALHHHVPELNLNFFRWLSEPKFDEDETYLALLWQAEKRQKAINALVSTWEASSERDYFLAYLKTMDGLINRRNIRRLSEQDLQALDLYHDGNLQEAYQMLGFNFQDVINAEETLALHLLSVPRQDKNMTKEINLFAWPSRIEWKLKKSRKK